MPGEVGQELTISALHGPDTDLGKILHSGQQIHRMENRVKKGLCTFLKRGKSALDKPPPSGKREISKL